MLAPIFNTLRVLVDGPEEKEDEKLLPSQLFDDSTVFNQAVFDLLEQHDIKNIFEFIRLCVSVDTSIAYRLNETSGIDPEDWDEGIRPSDYVGTLRSIDDSFAVSDSVHGAKIMDGTVSPDPHLSGLTGRFLQLYKDVIGDEDNHMSQFLDLMKTACQYNPSTNEAWWLDTLRHIYFYDEDIAEEDISNWYSETDESVTEAIQHWYLRLNPILHKLISLFSDIAQNAPLTSIMAQLSNPLAEEFMQLVTRYDELDAQLVCEKASEASDLDISTIEDTIFGLMVVFDGM